MFRYILLVFISWGIIPKYSEELSISFHSRMKVRRIVSWTFKELGSLQFSKRETVDRVGETVD